MAQPTKTNQPDYAKSEQSVQNRSFDDTYNVLAFLLLAEYNNALYRLQVDSNGNLKTTANLSATDNAVLDNIDANTTPTTGLNTGRKVVTTAGTAVAIATSTTCKWVQITAETDNTDLIVVGDSGVIASLSTREGTPLNPGDTLTIPIDNLSDVYIDSLVSGEGVTFLYGT